MRTNEEEEFMTDTQDIFEAWKRETSEEARAEGLEKGRVEGLASGLVVIYEIRFGAMPAELRAIVETTNEAATLIGWLQLVETRSADVFAASVLKSRAG
jgi:flagellar biosynthesis/type III secretory pathway protein FliH